MLKILEKLNNPRVVVTVLAVILLANGYLLYYQWNSNSNPPDDASVSETVSETASDNESRPEATDEETTVSDPPPEETTEIEDETTSEETTSSEDEESNEKNSGSSAESEDKKPKDGSDSKDSDRKDKNKNRSDEDVPVLAGLEEFIRGCDAGVEKCIRNYVSRESPKSRYVAGRTDLGSEKKNVDVLYFEVPDLAPCEYERELYKTKDGREYAVIVLGPGSFSDERADECIPQA